MAGRKPRWARHNDLDEALVQAAVAGEKTRPLGTQERIAAVRALVAEGMNDRQLADRLWWWRKCDSATVAAFRARHGIPSGYTPHRVSVA